MMAEGGSRELRVPGRYGKVSGIRGNCGRNLASKLPPKILNQASIAMTERVRARISAAMGALALLFFVTVGA
jgi:hypothetical protein